MSGPKTSRYTLTPEQRRILAEQRKIERRKAVASEKIRRYSKRLLQIGGMFGKDAEVAMELMNRTGFDGGFAQKISELKALLVPVESMSMMTVEDSVESLEDAALRAGEIAVKAEKLAEEITVISTQNEVSLQTNLAEVIDQGFHSSFADIQAEQEDLDEMKGNLRLQLLQLKKNALLPADYAAQIERVIEGMEAVFDEVFLKNYSSLKIMPLVKKCNDFLAAYEACYGEFELLYTEYKALCELYDLVPQEYVCCPESIEILSGEIKRIKEVADEDDEQGYISRCLDEVMEEMGYSVLGSREVTKKNGKHFRNELYTYGEGTAVCVTYSSDGRIAMELGGMDTEDRLPDEYETSMLCDEMETFCEDFKEIEKRLLAKGVILADRISLLPPNAEHAKIINTTEFELQSEAEKIRTKKQRRVAEKLKTMKRE